MDSRHLWFKTNIFEIIPGEDEETNPLLFGKQFAEWLRIKLISQGCDIEEVIPEDWGWCLMVSRKPIELLIGCVSVPDDSATKPGDPTPKGSDVVWSCTVIAEQSFFSRLFNRIDTTPALEHLFEQVRSVLLNEPKVTFVDEP